MKIDYMQLVLTFVAVQKDLQIYCIYHLMIYFSSAKFLDPKFALCDKARSVIRDLTDIALSFGNFDVTDLALKWRILPSI